MFYAVFYYYLYRHIKIQRCSVLQCFNKDQMAQVECTPSNSFQKGRYPYRYELCELFVNIQGQEMVFNSSLFENCNLPAQFGKTHN